MSTSKSSASPRRSERLRKNRGSELRNVVGVTQTATQSVDDYKAEFFEKAKSLRLLDDEMLLAKWFRDGLREDIKARVRKTTTYESMDQIIDLAYLVETELETIPPEESVDKCMVSCDDIERDDDNNNEEDEEVDDDFLNEDEGEDSLHGDLRSDSRYWVYDDLDDWGQEDPPE